MIKNRLRTGKLLMRLSVALFAYLLSEIRYYVRVLFFFSSRRRHTRCSRDWSSDVCSSDLEHVPLRVLLEGVAIASANDAAAALAEHLAGDEASFVDRMNTKGKEFGMAATRFANAHGLPDPLQRTNAKDMALLIARLLHDYPAARTLLGGQTFIYRGRVYARHIPLFDDPLGVQALKTGFTHEAGYNLAVAAWRGGQEFVMIVLGSRSRAQSFLDAKRVLRFGFVETGLDPPEPKRSTRL